MNETTNINAPKYETNEQIRMELRERFGEIDKEIAITSLGYTNLYEVAGVAVTAVGIAMTVIGYCYNVMIIETGYSLIAGGILGGIVSAINKPDTKKVTRKLKLQQANIVFQNSFIKDNKALQDKILQEFKL